MKRLVNGKDDCGMKRLVNGKIQNYEKERKAELGLGLVQLLVSGTSDAMVFDSRRM